MTNEFADTGDLDLALIARLGGHVAEYVRVTQSAERSGLGFRPGENRQLARLVYAPITNGYQLNVPRWSYLLGHVQAEVLPLRRPNYQPESGRWRLLRGAVSEAWYRWASPALPSLRQMTRVGGPYIWIIFPFVLRVGVAVWVGKGKNPSLLVEYEPSTGYALPGVFRLPGEFVEADRDILQHAYRVLEQLGLWKGHHPQEYWWSLGLNDGIGTMRIDIEVEAWELNDGFLRDQRRLLVSPGAYRSITRGRLSKLRKHASPHERTALKPLVSVADDVRTAFYERFNL